MYDQNSEQTMLKLKILVECFITIQIWYDEMEQPTILITQTKHMQESTQALNYDTLLRHEQQIKQ